MLTKLKNEVLNLHDKELLAALKDHFMISILDASGRVVYANSNFYNVFGLPSKVGEIKANQLLRSLVHSQELYGEICQTILAGKKWQGLLFHNVRNTKVYCLETNILPVKDPHGSILKYVAFSNDISGQYCKAVSNNTSCNNEKRLLENSTDQALFITKQGKIFNTSQGDLNDDKNPIIGANIYDFVNSENHDYLKKQFNTAFIKGKISTYESFGLSAKGKQVLFVTKIKPVFNLQHEVIYTTLKSKKHKSGIKVNKALKAIETKYSNIFQSINVGIIVVANGNGIIIEWNKGAEKAFGYTDSEIIGEHLSKIISEKYLDSGLQELLKAKENLDNNLNAESMEMIGLKKTGEEFPVEFTMSHWQNGKEKFYCAIMLDISKRKKLEEKLKKTTKELELFLYRSAHDLKAPLTSAEGLLLLLKEEHLNDQAMTLVNMLDETLEKGRLLLEDLALASIISEKRREINPIKFEQNIQTAVSELKGIENFDGVDFQFDIVQEAEFYFNRELLDFIFQNLMRNVICFAKPKTKVHAPSAMVCVKVTDQELRITVSDNGLGIDNQHIDKVFDLYFSVCKKNSNATGLGLYIVKRIVEEFYGDVTVKSELNKGTSFEVILPNLKGDNLNDD